MKNPSHLHRLMALIFAFSVGLGIENLFIPSSTIAQTQEAKSEAAASAFPKLDWKNHSFSWKIFTRKEKATPSLSEDLVLVGTQSKKFLAVNQSSGKLLWEKSMGVEISSQPLAYDQKVFFGNINGHFHCLSLKDGHVLWTKIFESPILAQPAFSQNVIFVQTMDDQVHALETENGKTLWTHRNAATEVLALFWPTGPQHADGVVYAAAKSGVVNALEAQTGRTLWRADVGDFSANLGGALGVTIRKPLLFIPVHGQGLYALGLNTGQRRWQFTEAQILSVESSDEAGQPIYVNTFSGTVYALDAADGKVIWKKDLGLKKGDFPGPLTFWQGRLFVGDSRGKLYGIDVKKGVVQASYQPFWDHSGFVTAGSKTPQRLFYWSEHGTLYAFHP